MRLALGNIFLQSIYIVLQSMYYYVSLYSISSCKGRFLRSTCDVSKPPSVMLDLKTSNLAHYVYVSSIYFDK